MSGHDLPEAWASLGALVLAKHDFNKSGIKFSAVFAPEKMPQVAQWLLDEEYFLEDIVGMQVKEGLLATYHFDSFENPGRLAVRSLANAHGAIKSISNIYQGAEWHERETTDFIGLEFTGNTNPVPLLLAADFPDPPPLLRAEKDRASMSDLKLFGEAPDVLDPAWKDIVFPPAAKKEEDEA